MKTNGKVHCFFEQEEWKDIKGFEGLYSISNYGRVKSLKRICRANTCGLRTIEEKILSPCIASVCLNKRKIAGGYIWKFAE